MKVVVTFLVTFPGARQSERPAATLAATGVGSATLMVPCNMIVQLHLVKKASGAQSHTTFEGFL